jgi:hypothetical protein
LHHNLQSARWYAERIGGGGLEINLATEGTLVELS